MPYLILSDIHANLEALHAVLDDARGRYERILCLGDLVGYNPDPNPVLEWARGNAVLVVRGNHDKDCSNSDSLDHYTPRAIASTLWTRAQLTAENREYLRALPRGPVRVDDFDLVHGSPADEDEYLLSAEDAWLVREQAGAQATFFGHTHVQGGFLLAPRGVKTIAGSGTLELEPDYLYLLNPGAVGQPRDGDPRASYALYWPKERVVEYRRVEYDVAKTAAKIRHAGLPESLAMRLTAGM